MLCHIVKNVVSLWRNTGNGIFFVWCTILSTYFGHIIYHILKETKHIIKKYQDIQGMIYIQLKKVSRES